MIRELTIVLVFVLFLISAWFLTRKGKKIVFEAWIWIVWALFFYLLSKLSELFGEELEAQVLELLFLLFIGVAFLIHLHYLRYDEEEVEQA